MRIATIIIAVFVLFTLPCSAAQLMFDDFEYTIGRDVAEDADNFKVYSTWDGVKAENGSLAAGGGYFYTVTSIPGFSGSFPGTNSSTVMCAEFLPSSVGGQTDAYLVEDGSWSGDIWYQFWIYVNRYGSQMSEVDDTKFLYTCRSDPPGQCGGSDFDALVVAKEASYWPYYNNTAPAGSFYTGVEGLSANYNDEADGAWKLGENISSGTGVISPNEWVLVKIHIDATGSSGLALAGQGVYEQWHMVQGETEFTKIAEWYGGVTANFTWTISSPGIEWFKLFTTANGSDFWIYFDDFTIAEEESDLPTYSASDPVFTIEGLTIQ